MINQESQFDDPTLIADLNEGRATKTTRIPSSQLVDQIVHRARSGAGVDFDVFEALIGENDLVEVNYLERGMMASRTVCRINIAAMLGDVSDWGTGFLIAPGLLLTNNHVIPAAQDALRATVEFGYELDAIGRIKSTSRFSLRPQDGFIFSPKGELDYTIVAIADKSDDGLTCLSDLGYLRLDPRINKIDVGQYVTVIQHPDARTKRISLRENKVVKYGDDQNPKRDNFLWYSSDTAPGSSGAPVCTDAWQVVCLHHAGVPERVTVDGGEHWVLADGSTAPADIARHLAAEKVHWLANEGVRVSRLLDDLSKQTKTTPTLRTPRIGALVDDVTGVQAFPDTLEGQSIVGPSITGAGGIIKRVPFPSPSFEAARTTKHNTRPSNYFDGRTGYDENFLPSKVPLPTIGPVALQNGTICPVAGATDNVLRYLHFSVMFNGDEKRKIAYFTAVNIDGARWTNLDRGTDKWYYDPRIPEELQNGDDLYSFEPGPQKNYFDRGHLVRRLDPVWGDIRMAAQANDDTFYWTNCSPQYWGFNEGQDLWAGLENFLLYNTDEEDVRATVFSGPILRSDDEEHRGILIPQYFWKVICVADKAAKLFSSGYVVSQKDYALDIPFEVLPVGPNSAKPGQNFQVPITQIETETGIIFSDVVRSADVYIGPATGRKLRSLADVQHPKR